MKKVKFIIVGILCSLLLSLGGVYLGLQVNEEQQALYKVSTIAIVNLDNGITYNQEERNFGAELLKNNNEDYVLTGITDARNGVEDGEYAAYIIIPADFSENVTSVNSNPTTASLSYTVASNLETSSKEETLYKIFDFENTFNTSLSNMYVSSVLSTFHDGQDSAIVVTQNDQIDLELIEAIHAMDLVTMVELSELTVLDNTISNLDIDEQIKTGESLMESVDSSYKEFMQLSDSQLASIKAEYVSLDTSLDTFGTNIETFKSIFDNEGNPTYDLADLQDYISQVQGALETNIEEYVNKTKSRLTMIKTNVDVNMFKAMNYQTQIQTQINQLLINNPTMTYQDAIDEYELTSDGSIESNIGKFFTILGVNQEPTITNFNTYYQANQTTLENRYNQTIINTNNAVAFNIDDFQSPELTYVDNEVVATKVQEALKGLDEQQKNFIATLESTFGTQKGSSQSLLQTLNQYDPLSNIDNRVIESHVRDFNKNSSELTSIVNEKNSEYLDFVDQVYSTSNEHISSLRDDVLSANESSNEAIETGLGNLKSVKLNNSEQNQSVLGDFISKLPNTRKASLTNMEVVTFMVQPIISDGEIMPEVEVIKDNSTEKYVTYSMSAVAVALVLGTASIFGLKRHSKEKS